MRVLLIGLSAIASRRVIPALASLQAVDHIDIASVSKDAPDGWPKRGDFFRDYEHAIAQSPAEVVYISLPNSMHAAWVMAALAANKHVIVDKPAMISLDDTRRAIAEAEKRSRLIAEATVFSHHPHIAALQRFVAEHGPLTHIDAQFMIPPLPAENFRTSHTLGGGCLLDMGPYAAALARLFGSGQMNLCAYAPAHGPHEIDRGFTLAAMFDNGVRYTGHFSFETEYQNRLLLVGAGASVNIERIFSPPPDLEVAWQIRCKNQASEQKHPPSDSFRNFLEAALDAIYSGGHSSFSQDMLADALVRERLAQCLAQRSQ